MGVPAVLTCALAHARLQLTPLAASEIAAILKADFGSTVIPIYSAAQLKRCPLGGIWTERGLVHEMQLMVMHAKVIVCWPDLSQACRDEQCIRMASRAGMVPGQLIWSCPMQSKAKLCRCGLVKRITCG